jgi:DMSO/TMAO reductase YedYZ molybdopterin-dependent catalytic subunit
LTEKTDDLKELQGNPKNCEAMLPNLRADLTEERAFYVRNHFPSPEIAESQWNLVVEFDGSKKRAFSYAELLKMPQRTVAATLECAGNGRKGFRKTVKGEIGWGDGAVSTAIWGGVSIATLIKEAGLLPLDMVRVSELIFIGADGSKNESEPLESKNKYCRSLSLDKSMHQDTIVAVTMNGEPLSKDHGYPVRLIVPGWYAMASVKWLDRVIISTNEERFLGHFNWTKYVYVTVDDGKITKEPIRNLKVKSLITSLEDGATISIGKPIAIEGKAWSGFGCICKVEVDLGDGWRYAELQTEDDLGQYAWKNWSQDWTPRKKGTINLRVRATDEKGNTQPETPEMNKYLYGYNGIHEIAVTVA